MNSAIFEGRVRHRRMLPVPHAFRYRLFMMFLDLDELETVFRGRWLWSVRRIAVARFRREDHFGDPHEPLDVSIRRHVQQETGRWPRGPVRLLTHLRYFGYCFNPVSFFYCYDEDDKEVETIVAEVNNTPWGERHLYVLNDHARSGNQICREFAPKKVMHVSPFMSMDVQYLWRFTTKDDRLFVHMETARGTEKIFDATLALTRSEVSGPSLARVLLCHPLMTLKVIAAIHWQALRLWLKGTPVYSHRPKSTKFLENQS
jgi:uncharacterized protein